MIPTDAELATYLDQIGEFELAGDVRKGLLDENQMACITEGYEFDRPAPEPEHPMERAFGALASLTGETMRERIADAPPWQTPSQQQVQGRIIPLPFTSNSDFERGSTPEESGRNFSRWWVANQLAVDTIEELALRGELPAPARGRAGEIIWPPFGPAPEPTGKAAWHSTPQQQAQGSGERKMIQLCPRCAAAEQRRAAILDLLRTSDKISIVVRD